MKITVFLGSSSGNDPIYTEKIRELGHWIGKSGHTLVFGASNSGLMGELASAVKAEGGKMIGVGVKIPFIQAKKRNDLDEYIEAEHMQIRKKTMMELGDAFIAFPGSLGTLEELADVIAAIKIDEIDKPCFIFNINGFYDPLEKLIDNMCNAEFMEKASISKVHFVTAVCQIEDLL